MSSCGGSYEYNCVEVLEQVYIFLDSECDQVSRTHIAQHLEECAPCLQHFGIEREVKELVHRKCGGDAPPAGLRDRVRLRLSLVAVEQELLG